MTVTATDDDEPGNPNSQIKYSILSQSPGEGMFFMKDDGKLYVLKPMDREVGKQMNKLCVDFCLALPQCLGCDTSDIKKIYIHSS